MEGTRTAARICAGLVLVLLLLFVPAGAFGGRTDHRAVAVSATGATPTTFLVEGRVLDQYSGAPLVGTTVRSIGIDLRWDNTTTDGEGRFAIHSVPGPVYLTVDPPAGYRGIQLHLTLGPAPLRGVVLQLTPVAYAQQLSDRTDQVWWAGIIGAVLSISTGVIAVARRNRRDAGLPPGLLSPFGRFVVRRLLLIPFQLGGLLILLYAFGTFLPALARAQLSNCLVTPDGSCASCPPSQWSCQAQVFGSGLWQFLAGLLTGHWGLASIGFLKLPAVEFLQWWLPFSLELAVLALAISIAIGYPLGLLAGWRSGGLLDQGIRSISLGLLLIPTFLVVLFALIAVYDPWRVATSGDTPYGLLPTSSWLNDHGGFRSWVGIGGQTSPTGFPLVDAAIHGDWSFEAEIAAKNLLQAVLIATIYVAIFFRYARQSASEAARSAALRAARSRGVPESTLLWRHTGRRVLPVYLLTFGMTLPAYLGTQAVVEALFNDQPGLGTILFSEMFSVGQTGFGIAHHGSVAVGNLYQVMILFLAILLLLGNLCADVLARLLDPTLTEGAR